MAGFDRYKQVIDLLDVYHYSKDPLHLQSAFRLLDLNGDGFLSFEEWMAFYRAAEEEEEDEEYEDLFRLADCNGDGMVDEREYVAMVETLTSTFGPDSDEARSDLSPQDQQFEHLHSEYRRSKDPALLTSLFQMIDTHSEGVITKADLQASPLVKRAPNKALAVKLMLQMADLKQNEALGIDEFRILISNL